jgi:hypothetical protein
MRLAVQQPGWKCVLLLAAGWWAVVADGARGQAEPPPGSTAADLPPVTTSKSTVEYIDPALPQNLFRLRFGAAYDNNRPDRAEYFYSQYQPQVITGQRGSPVYVNTPPSGRVATTGGGGPTGGRGGPGPGGREGENLVFSQPGDIIGNPKARGLPRPETRIDYQDISGYLEVAPSKRFSGFLEVPVRFLNPEQNANTAGLADINAGFKWAFLYSPEQVATFQLRTYLPTGASTHGLGTNHVSLEPALLFYQQLTDRLTLESQLSDWIPIGGTDFEGNVLQYGVGLSYLAYERGDRWVRPVVEFLGWTVLNGKETAALTPTLFAIESAGGDTILNAKVGVRVGLGEKSDCYIGYGRALTGDVWYKNIFRLEYRLSF